MRRECAAFFAGVRHHRRNAADIAPDRHVGHLTHARFNRGTHDKMEKYTIRRDGLPPIAFTGEPIAAASNHSHQGPNQNRWVNVEIYRTQGGAYVAAVERRTCWQGESDAFSAAARKTAAEVIDWLKKDDGTIGDVSQDAVEQAVTNDPGFAAAWVEIVE
jgi:hypothetical protein